MKVRTAVITAAAENQRALPLQTLIDRDGQEKPVLAILAEQVLSGGVEQIGVVVCPGDEAPYGRALARHLGHIRFIPQHGARGYGHALWCAREFTADEPFLHLVGDHLYVNDDGAAPAGRLLQLAETEECSVSGVQITREGLLPNFGAIGGRRLSGREGVYRVETVLEKPSPTEAELKLAISGMRAGHYLCFFGMHVLTPGVMEILERQLEAAPPGARTPLSAALAELARREQYLALEEFNRRYDIGARYGLLTAQLALALHGRDRADVLANLVDLLATQQMAASGGRGAQ
jgi:UTP--glucose-1-phosphate uridylyltransferase